MRKIIPLILLIMFIPFIVKAEPLSVTDCDNNTLYTTIPSNLKGLAKIMANQAYLDNGKSKYVNSCSGITFTPNSNNTNGKGVYEIASTKNDNYPIYYYRGAVDNNNVKFAGFCWKAIRTTDTGGVKMIYSGVPNENGECINTTGSSNVIGEGVFNSNDDSIAYAGYMYGNVFISSNKTASSLNNTYVYGKDVTYSNGIYTLTDTMTSTGNWGNDYNTLNNNHYTCFSTSTTCTSVYYIHYTYNSRAYYITLTGGKKVEDALNEMFINTTDSSVKTTIDNWYSDNITEYTNFIEDTIYCNDRSISELNGWNPNGGDTTKNLYFSPYLRYSSTHKPTLVCNRIEDSFTVSNSKGNGALTYPVGLITLDEALYAGAYNSVNTNHYLYSQDNYWLLSPSFSLTYRFMIADRGTLLDHSFSTGTLVTNSGYRPVISLKSSNSVCSGNGMATKPYVIDVNNEYYNISVENNNKTEDINIDVDDVSYVKVGKTITFRITPIDDYAIDTIRILDKNNNEISINSTGNENEYSFVMPDSDVTIIPSYKKNKFEVNIDIENETEDFDINIENLTSVLVGENVVFKVTPIKGYKINNIKIIDSNDNEISYISTDNKNEYSFIMPESNVTIIPRYEKVSNSVNVEDNENTKEIVIEVNDSKAVVYEDVVVFKIVPEDGYEIKDIIITDKNNNKVKYEKTSNNNEYKFKMPDTDVTIKPIYRKIEVDNKKDIIKNPKTGIGISLIILIIVFVISHYIKKQKIQFN